MRPGDRKRRWKQSCGIGGFIMAFIGLMLILNGDIAGDILGGIVWFFAAWSFLDMQRGWKISYKLPPKYYRDIKSKNPITRQIAKEAAEATRNAAKNPKRKRYAFRPGK